MLLSHICKQSAYQLGLEYFISIYVRLQLILDGHHIGWPDPPQKTNVGQKLCLWGEMWDTSHYDVINILIDYRPHITLINAMLW